MSKLVFNEEELDVILVALVVMTQEWTTLKNKCEKEYDLIRKIETYLQEGEKHD